MIRFNCTNCGRHYELINAMAHLRLVCKKCGQPLAVPEPGPDPEPEPEPEPPPPPPPIRPPTPVPRPKAAPPPVSSPKLHAGGDDQPASDEWPAVGADVGVAPPGPAAKPPTPPPDLLGSAPAPAAPPAARGKALYAVVDVAVGLIVLAAGVFLGETLARKSTAQVLRDAGSAVRFPPEDLLMWAAPPLLAGLVYLLLAARGRTVGGWLRRKAAG